MLVSNIRITKLVCNVFNRNCSSQIGILRSQSVDTSVDQYAQNSFVTNLHYFLFSKQCFQLRYMWTINLFIKHMPCAINPSLPIQVLHACQEQ